MQLNEVVSYQDSLLRIGEIAEYPNALNGLQVANAGGVSKIAAAVDACETVLRMAVGENADLLIVHHGLFWNGLAPVTGALWRKLHLALTHNLAIYSVHLPLDAHPELGNNALLCNALGLQGERKPFLDVGLQVESPIARAELREKLEAAVGGPVHLAPGGPEMAGRIGVVTGGAGGEVGKAARDGIDTFITGEGPHWSYTAAEELGINLFYAGHYATETFGVKALAAHLAARFDLPWVFIDHPTGL